MSGGDDYLFSGESIPTPTLQKMEGAFGKAGLNGFTIEGGRVKVPHAQRAAYLAALADAKALPPNFGDKLKEAEDGNLFESPKQREERLRLSKAGSHVAGDQLHEGIERASVLIDQQARSEGFDLTPLKTASVEAQAIGGVPLDDDQVDKIRYYVTAANAGMKPENVTITDANGRAHPGQRGDHGGADGDPYARAVRKAEQDLNDKDPQCACLYPQRHGDFHRDARPRERQPQRRNQERSQAGAGANLGEYPHVEPRIGLVRRGAGLPAQGGGANQPASLGANGGKGSNETNEETKNETGQRRLARRAPRRRLRPDSENGQGLRRHSRQATTRRSGKERNPAKEGEEAKKPDQAALDKIREEITQDVRTAVATLLPTAPDVKDPTSLVTVTTFQDIKAAEIPGPAVTQRALTWLGQNWPMVAMVGLVLFSLGMLRSMLRSVPAPPAESAAVSMRVTALRIRSPKSPKRRSKRPPPAASAA